MIKSMNKRKLSRTSSHRRALLRNLASALFMHEKITTTYAKARELQRFAERLLTIAGGENRVNVIRRLERDIKSREVLHKILDVIVPRYKQSGNIPSRNCGRVAVYKAGYRKSDSAMMAVVKLV